MRVEIKRRRHVLDLDDFTREEMEILFERATSMKEILAREIKKVPTLRGKRIATLFYEPSTRTRVSFEIAAKTLSADVVNIQASSSSVAKGESLIDTLKTLRSLGIDLVVLRHPSSGAPYLASRFFDGSIINAGDGTHAHPTQALLDIYTVKERLGYTDNIKLLIVGDVAHSRVARSNIIGFHKMGARITICSPPTLIPKDIKRAYPWVEIDFDLDRAIKGADVIMALRIQKERQEEKFIPSIREYIRLYQINRERLKRAKEGAILLHPGPVNEGIELSMDVMEDSKSLIGEQVKNGVAIRMALLYTILGGR